MTSRDPRLIYGIGVPIDLSGEGLRRTNEARPIAGEGDITMTAARPAATARDTTYITRLSQVFEAVKDANPRLAPIEAMERARKIVDGDGIDRDPDRLVLHRMAERYALEHRVDYRQALMAVSREYDALMHPPIAAVDRSSEQLSERAERYMREHPDVSFRNALLEVSRVDGAENLRTVKNPPYPAPGSAAKADADTQPDMPTNEEIETYQKKHPGMTYRQALLELARDYAKMPKSGGNNKES